MQINILEVRADSTDWLPVPLRTRHWNAASTNPVGYIILTVAEGVCSVCASRRFDPDRFTPEREAQRPRYSFVPFGFAGGRQCPGFRCVKLPSQCSVCRVIYIYIVQTLNPIDGNVISGAAAKKEMVKSKLPNSSLGKVWRLADFDKDGKLPAFCAGAHPEI